MRGATMEPLPHHDAVIQEKAADLIDDRGPLSHQAIAHAMQRLQIELLIGFGGTHRVVGRCKASATACASRKSFLWVWRKGLA